MLQVVSVFRGFVVVELVYMYVLFKLNYLRIILIYVGFNNRYKCFYFLNLGKIIFKNRLLDCLIFSSFYK